MATLEHPTIGKIQGKSGNGVTQYLGLKYATLKDRFAEAELIKYSANETINATKFGYCKLVLSLAYTAG